MVVGNADVTGIDVRLPGAGTRTGRIVPLDTGPRYNITGNVTGSGSVSLEGISVYALALNGGYSGPVTTASDGTYSIDVPADDSYQIFFGDPNSAYALGWYSDSAADHYTADDALASYVAVGSSDVGGIDIQMPLGVHISGTVTGTGNVPLEGIIVGACPSGYCQMFISTAADGTYTIAVSPDQSEKVRFADPSVTYADGYYDSSAGDGYTSDYWLATDVAVTSSDVPGIDITLPLLVHISGTVTGPGNVTLEGIDVNVSSTTAGGYGYATTAADGTYTASVPPDESYQVFFSDSNQVYADGYYDSSAGDGYTSDASLATDVAVTSSDVPGIDITLPLLVHISGTVTGPGNVTLEGIDVNVSSTTAGGYGYATTAADGTYTASVPPDESYQVFFSDSNQVYADGYYDSSAGDGYTSDASLATDVAVTSSDVPGIDITLPLLVHISGTVTGPGNVTLEGIDVNVSSTTAGGYGYATTAADGTYTASVPPDESYQVFFSDSNQVYADGYYDSSAGDGYTSDASLATDVAVTSSDVPGIDITLPLLVHISGTVTGPGNVTLEGIDVFAVPTTCCGFEYTTTAGDGTYSIAVLPGFSYQLQFLDSNYVYGSGFYDSSAAGNYVADPALSTDVVVASNDVPGIDITLPLAVHISGTVTGPGNVTLGGINLVAIATDYGFGGYATSELDGTYSLAVPPGQTYVIWLLDPNEIYAEGYYNSSAAGAFTYNYDLASGVAVDTTDVNAIDVQMPLAGTNTAPVATPDSYATAGAAELDVAAPGVLGNDTDAETDPLAAVLESDVSHGTLVLASDGGFSYAPTGGYSGPDSFTYHATDGIADSNVVTVSLTVDKALLQGTVTVLASGDAVSGATVSAWDATSWAWKGASVTAGDGTYAINLPAGSYNLYIQGGGQPASWYGGTQQGHRDRRRCDHHHHLDIALGKALLQGTVSVLASGDPVAGATVSPPGMRRAGPGRAPR